MQRARELWPTEWERSVFFTEPPVTQLWRAQRWAQTRQVDEPDLGHLEQLLEAERLGQG